MHNWNWSYTLSKSVVALAIASSLASNSAQAQTGTQTEIKSTSSSTSLKVGETRSQSLVRVKDDSVARIHSHKLDGKNAATVYVRGIPVVTYIESEDSANSDVIIDSSNSLTKDKVKSEDKGESKGLIKKNSESLKLPSNSEDGAKLDRDDYQQLLTSADPVERATATAALINQLSRDGLDADKIIPAWRNGNYVIKFGDRATLKFDEQVLFPVSLRNETRDVLESANLLRRLLGGASPVADVLDAPKPKVVATPVPVFSKTLNDRVVGVMSGMASWYGPGFDGNYSASGEIFNANELTAAHPSLPFGTVVRVVNMDNGQSVVVRINDRGPYAHGRIIDISTAAANVIGLISSGVAPVRIEVLGR
ncbi:MAG: septal ring lytic transglycosylase RlpA family protein [Pseudanabaena sp.]|nr:MAG: septal ring lytic transglycosylase RlpA family protein [Pseudanabaena sp.]